MRIRSLLNLPKSHYSAAAIMRWLWHAWRGNRLQATLNASIGLATVVLSLVEVWAMQHAIDVASGVVKGNLYWAVGLMGLLILCNFLNNFTMLNQYTASVSASNANISFFSLSRSINNAAHYSDLNIQVITGRHLLYL
mgnify:CR=1 FL=1